LLAALFVGVLPGEIRDLCIAFRLNVQVTRVYFGTAERVLASGFFHRVETCCMSLGVATAGFACCPIRRGASYVSLLPVDSSFEAESLRVISWRMEVACHLVWPWQALLAALFVGVLPFLSILWFSF